MIEIMEGEAMVSQEEVREKLIKRAEREKQKNRHILPDRLVFQSRFCPTLN